MLTHTFSLSLSLSHTHTLTLDTFTPSLGWWWSLTFSCIRLTTRTIFLTSSVSILHWMKLTNQIKVLLVKMTPPTQDILWWNFLRSVLVLLVHWLSSSHKQTSSVVLWIPSFLIINGQTELKSLRITALWTAYYTASSMLVLSDLTILAAWLYAWDLKLVPRCMALVPVLTLHNIKTVLGSTQRTWY